MKKLLLAILSLSLLISSGCGRTPSGGAEDAILYNSNDQAYFCETEGYLYYWVGSTEFRWVCESVENGEISRLIRDPLWDGLVGGKSYGVAGEENRFLFADSNGVYELLDSRLDRVSQKVELIRFDPVDFSTEVCFQTYVGMTDEYLMGLREAGSSSNSDFNNVDGMFISGSQLYLIYSGNDKTKGIYRQGFHSLGQELVIELTDAVKNVAFDGERVYYLDSLSQLAVYTLADGQTQTCTDVICADFRLTKDGIYFINRADNRSIWLYETDTGQMRKLGGAYASSLWEDDTHVYFRETGESGLYRICKEGGEPETVIGETDGVLLLFHQSDWIYLWAESTEEGELLTRIHKETGEQTVERWEHE